MSNMVLDILPLPFVVIGGSCPRKNYQARTKSTSRCVTVTTSGGVKIDYDLDFRQGFLKRIAVFVAHPSVGFFRPNTANDDMVRLDAAMNLFLHLLAIDHDEDMYAVQLFLKGKGIPGSAPFSKMHEYRRLEEQLGRPLEIEEYDTDFMSWAHHYLQRSGYPKNESDGTVAQNLHEAWRASLAESHIAPERQQQHGAHNRQNNAVRYGWEFREYWHGQTVKIHKNQIVRLYISPSQKALRFAVSKQVRLVCEASGNSPIILFDDGGLSLKLGETVIHRRTRQQLLKLACFGTKGLKQLDKELLLLSLTKHEG